MTASNNPNLSPDQLPNHPGLSVEEAARILSVDEHQVLNELYRGQLSARAAEHGTTISQGSLMDYQGRQRPQKDPADGSQADINDP